MDKPIQKIILEFNGSKEVIEGCKTCFFLHYEERGADYNPYCSISKVIVEDENFELWKHFPINCPIQYGICVDNKY